MEIMNKNNSPENLFKENEKERKKNKYITIYNTNIL